MTYFGGSFRSCPCEVWSPIKLGVNELADFIGELALMRETENEATGEAWEKWSVPTETNQSLETIIAVSLVEP